MTDQALGGTLPPVAGPATSVAESGGLKRAALLDRVERLALGFRLTMAMLAAGLLALGLLWQWAFPQEALKAQLVDGAAALLVAVPVLAAASESLRHPSLHGVTDRLIALALVAAWAAGDLTTAAVLPIIMILGHVLEERSLIGARDAIKALSKLTQATARRVRADGSGAVEIVRTGELVIGDVIEVRAGDRVPADGIVRSGAASLDVASLTGESVPVEVAVGDAALAGSIDLDGLMTLGVTRVGADTTLGRIIELMRTAEHAKPPITRVLERHAGRYIAFILTIAAGTWFASGDTAAMLAVLVASCPCALVLAAPATAIAAISVAARHGILIKGTAFLEHLAEVDSVIFDKTGTLTLGELSLLPVESGSPLDRATRLAAALGAGSSHPVSRAVCRAVPPAERPRPEQVREEGGFGMTGLVDGGQVAFGRPDLFDRLGIHRPVPPEHDGPIAGVSYAGDFLGWLRFADQPRPEAADALRGLRTLGLDRQLLLTGDRSSVAHAIAARLGIVEVAAEALPEQKMRRVQAEIAAGYRPMVVGDGINDSLALKVGAVGIAMGAQGTDVALASADLVLITSDLARLATAIRLSRACRRTIGVNVGLGLGWTLLLVGLASAGALGAEGAILAAFLHNVSTFVGLANSGRLLRFSEPKKFLGDVKLSSEASSLTID